MSLIGQHFGAYQVHSLLGAGGMGEVYRAHDSRLGRDVALKLLPAAFTADADRLARFEREARVLAALNHPHIGAIYGLEESAGVRALVLELVEGETLAERIARTPASGVVAAGFSRTGLPVAEALAIARQIADALDAAHEKGIVHRDLKPANIKITPDGLVKVLDFGLATTTARAEGMADSATIPIGSTREGMLAGTVAYMSPEQARGLPIDKRTDIWAFGCVLYEMLTGRTVFGKTTITDTLAAIIEREPDWSALPGPVPLVVRHLLQRCLEKDPKQRLRDIADGRAELQHAGRLPERLAPGAAPAPSGVLFRYGWAGWIVAGATAAAAVGFVLYPRSASETPAAIELSIPAPRGATFPFEEGAPWPTVSPDGRHVAFVAVAADGRQQLWLRSMDSAAAQPLPGIEGAARPFWSPDSRSLGYFADGRLWRFDLPSAPPQAVTDAPYLGSMSASWGDGVIVLTHVGGLYRVPAAGGPATLIRSRDAMSGAPATPAFLPDGRRFLYVLERPRQADTEICVGAVDAADHTADTCVLNAHSPAKYGAPGYLLFVRNGLLRAQPFDAERLEVFGQALSVGSLQLIGDPVWRPTSFSVSDNGVLAHHPSAGETQLVWVDRTGKTLTRVGPVGDYGNPELSADERRIMVVRRDRQTGNVDLWLYGTGSGAGTRFTFDPAADSSPVFSPDGERVAFSSTRDGVAAIYQKPTNGVGVEEVLVRSGGILTDWSADGRFLLLQRSDTKTGWDLWAVPTAGERQPFAVVQSEHGEREGAFSPDSRWVAYDSTESGRREIWIQPFPPTGAKWQVSTVGGFSPRWRGDGRELFYVASDGRLMAAAIGAGPTPEVGVSTPLMQTMFREGAYGSYAVARDGQRFLLNMPPPTDEAAPITVIVNWTSKLRN